SPDLYTLSLHDALPISSVDFRRLNTIFGARRWLLLEQREVGVVAEHPASPPTRDLSEHAGLLEAANEVVRRRKGDVQPVLDPVRSEEHTSELQSPDHLV